MGSNTFRGVPSVDKAARLLAALDAREPLGISELARRISASKGTVRDVLLTLAISFLDAGCGSN
ncbi:MAG: helix-turn-helix domain-containing protein, partial [Chloroflexota bacterium]